MQSESKIFLNSFPTRVQLVEASNEANDRKRFLIGFDLANDKAANRHAVISSVVQGLISHDVVCLRVGEFSDVLAAFGSEDTAKMLQADALRFVDDGLLDFPVYYGNEGAHLGRVQRAGPGLQSSVRFLEDRLIQKGVPSNSRNVLLGGIERNLSRIDVDWLEEIVKREVDFDLKNQNLTEQYGLASKTAREIEADEVLKIIRIAHSNAGMAYASATASDSIHNEAWVSQLLNHKFSPLTRGGQYQRIVEDITNLKGIPDLGDLYSSGALSMVDLLELRRSFNGVKFREWLRAVDYNQDEIRQTLYTPGTGLNFKVSKALRFVVTNTIGLVSPLGGIVSDAVDSFLVDKMLSGWHPSFFLDERLKARIDERIAKDEVAKRRKEVAERFKGVGRNDPCVCDSGKKFKKCCGRL